MKKKSGLFALIPFLFFLGCARQDSQEPRVNPFDANGTNWTINSNPVINLSSNATPLWSDFDFSDSMGSILCKASMTDNNGKYDTLITTFLIGTSPVPTDTVRTISDSGYCPDRLKPATKYYFSITARDKWDSVTSVSGSFTTPSGFPPLMTDSVQIANGYGSISLTWYKPDYSATYRIYRSTSPSGPFTLVADTVVSAWSTAGTYTDYVSDNQLYYYRLSALNAFGECRSKKVLFGYVYNSSVSAPYSLYASQGSYPDYIYLNWYSYTTTGTFYILRSTSFNGPFQIIDSVKNNSFYRDSLVNAPAPSYQNYYYYKIFLRDAQGKYSAPSIYAYGYVSLIPFPSNFSASQGAYYSYISLSWYYSSNVAGYYIYRSLSSSGPFTCIDTVVNTAYNSGSYLYYNDTVKTTDSYYYQIASYTPSKKVSGRSSTAIGYLQRPTAPSLSATKGTNPDCIVVTWNQNTSAKKYFIYRSYNSSAADSFKLFDSTTQTSYSDSVKLSGYYYYSVTMADVNGRVSGRSSFDYGYLGTLSAPYSVTASSTYSAYIALTWSSVVGAAGYYIYRSSATTGPFIVIDSTTEISYNDSSFTTDSQNIGDKKYYYTIQSYSKSGKTSTQSGYCLGILKGFPCPAHLTATPLYNKPRILLTWDSVALATGYCIYRASTYSGPFVKIGSSRTTSFTDTTALAGSYYYYTVSSQKGVGESAQSLYISAQILSPPSQVISFYASGTAAGIALSWSAPTSTVSGYTIYRSVDSGKTYTMALSGYYSSAFDSVNSGQLIYYKIAAYNAAGEGVATTSIPAKRLPPATPTSFAFTTPGSNYIALMWSISYGATGYTVFRALSPTSDFTQLSQATSTTFTDYQVQSGVVYYYKVAAFNPAGESALSAYIYSTAP